MAQALSPYAVPVLQIVAGVAVLQIMNGTNPLTSFVAKKITEISEEFLEAAKKVIFDSPVIAISTGLTYLVQEFVPPQIPSLSLAMPGCTSLKTAMYVAGILAIRSALSLYLERVANKTVLIDLGLFSTEPNKVIKSIQKTVENTIQKKESENNQIVENLRQTVIRNAVPIAAACTAAYYAEVPMRLAQTALYTAALIPVVKLLGKGLESFLSLEHVKTTAEKVIGWMN
jgi:hypothetical protein